MFLSPHAKKRLARQAIEQIVMDISDRRGLRQEWEACDNEIQAEIKKIWEDIIVEAIDNQLKEEKETKS